MSNMIVMFDIILYQILLPSDLHPFFGKKKYNLFCSKDFSCFYSCEFSLLFILRFHPCQNSYILCSFILRTEKSVIKCFIIIFFFLFMVYFGC